AARRARPPSPIVRLGRAGGSSPARPPSRGRRCTAETAAARAPLVPPALPAPTRGRACSRPSPVGDAADGDQRRRLAGLVGESMLDDAWEADRVAGADRV